MSETLKVGDTVIRYYSQYYKTAYTKIKIERETKTQWICKDEYNNESRYRKDNLRRIGSAGGGWYTASDWIMPLTPENEQTYLTHLERQTKAKAWSGIKSLAEPKHLTSDRLKEIYSELRGGK